jgi:small subunit ribosomal protein S15
VFAEERPGRENTIPFESNRGTVSAPVEKNADIVMPLTKERKQQLTGEFGRGNSDSGSPEVQVALLTNRISQMTDHLQLHSKDYSSRRGLLAMVSRRRRLLDYVKRINPQLYLDLLRRLEIRK